MRLTIYGPAGPVSGEYDGTLLWERIAAAHNLGVRWELDGTAGDMVMEASNV